MRGDVEVGADALPDAARDELLGLRREAPAEVEHRHAEGHGKSEEGGAVETESEEFDPSPSSGDYGRKVLIENDGENRGGKGGVGEIIHRPAKDLSFLNGKG